MKKYKNHIKILFTIVSMFFLFQVYRVKAEESDSFQALQGIVIVLDAGHGGKDDGAKGNGVIEQEVNLILALKLQEELKSYGATVILTRDGSYDLASESATNRKREDMQKRLEIINQDMVDLYISIHLNSFSNPSARGAQVFYDKDNESSKIFAEMVQANFKEDLDSRMIAKQGVYYVLEQSKKTGILVECGFLSNYDESKKLLDDSYQNKIVSSLSKSILTYFEFLQD